jgi:hypothetical protein
VLKENAIDFTIESAPNASLIDEYTETISKLTKENQEKERMNKEIMNEYENMMK